MVLVPAAMELLGERNWWLPGWLDCALPQISLERRPLPAAREAGGK
jgi:RND superfamily putative drug exporter